MTTFANRKVKCACCGKIVEVKRVMSYTTFYMTLDGNINDLYQYFLEVCPHCKYPSLDITKSTQISPSFVTKLYQIAQTASTKGKLSQSFVVAGMIYEQHHDYLNASYMYRGASWICLKENQVKLSTIYKKRTCENITRYLKSLDGFTPKDISICIILIDTYRQIGDFKEAKELCDDLINIISKFDETDEIKNYKKIINYEVDIIDKEDTHIHFVSEVN